MIVARSSRGCRLKAPNQCHSSNLQHHRMSPEYQRFLTQFEAYLPLPLSLVDIILSYSRIPSFAYLRRLTILAVTNNGQTCLVINPLTMKELRHIPMTPSLQSILDRDRQLDIVTRQNFPRPCYYLSPLDDDILVRIDATCPIVHSGPNYPQYGCLTQTVTWLRLSSLTTAGTPMVTTTTTIDDEKKTGIAPTSTASSSLSTQYGRYVMEKRYLTYTQEYVNNVLLPASIWYSWCGRYMFVPTVANVYEPALVHENKVKKSVINVLLNHLGANNNNEKVTNPIITFDTHTCEWLDEKVSSSLWFNEVAITYPPWWLRYPYDPQSTPIPLWQHQRRNESNTNRARLLYSLVTHIPGRMHIMASINDSSSNDNRSHSAEVVWFGENMSSRPLDGEGTLIYIDYNAQRWVRLTLPPHPNKDDDVDGRPLGFPCSYILDASLKAHT
jgi:hypothetical protein